MTSSKKPRMELYSTYEDCAYSMCTDRLNDQPQTIECNHDHFHQYNKKGLCITKQSYWHELAWLPGWFRETFDGKIMPYTKNAEEGYIKFKTNRTDLLPPTRMDTSNKDQFLNCCADPDAITRLEDENRFSPAWCKDQINRITDGQNWNYGRNYWTRTFLEDLQKPTDKESLEEYWCNEEVTTMCKVVCRYCRKVVLLGDIHIVEGPNGQKYPQDEVIFSLVLDGLKYALRRTEVPLEGQNVPKGIPYCSQCLWDSQGKICKKCHMPKAPHCFGDDQHMCNSCYKRHEKSVNKKFGGNVEVDGTGIFKKITFRPDSPQQAADPLVFFKAKEKEIINNLKKQGHSKWKLMLQGKFEKLDDQGQISNIAENCLWSNNKIFSPLPEEDDDDSLGLKRDDWMESDEVESKDLVPKRVIKERQIQEGLEADLAEVMQELYAGIDEFEGKGSGFRFQSNMALELNVAKYKPLAGTSYVELPDFIKHKLAIINVINHNDNKCFLWSVLAALYPPKANPNRLSHYKSQEHKIKTQGILTYPVDLLQIPHFEKVNQISINVFGLEDEESDNKSIVPLYHTKVKSNKQVNLFLYKGHYCTIKNLSKLLAYRTKHDGATYYCHYCLHGFSSKERLAQHTTCRPIDQAYQPEENLPNFSHVQFKNFKNKLRVPFVVYADLECLQVPDPDDDKIRHHVPSGICLLLVSQHPKVKNRLKLFHGKDCIDKFIEELYKINYECQMALKKHKIPMKPLTDQQVYNFQTASHCHICEKEFEPGLSRDSLVHDHDHLSGEYRACAHSSCNLQYQLSNRIPVIFHNLKGYDHHFIMQRIGHHTSYEYKEKDPETGIVIKSETRYRKITCVPCNTGKYLSFGIGWNIKFIDSCLFLSGSLDDLVQNLVKSGSDTNFKLLKENFKGDHNLLYRKSSFPYDYMDNFARFYETRLPPRAAFYNTLTKEWISDAHYEHAQNVWKSFACKTMLDYHNIYLKSDVCLLACVFENFRDQAMQYYELDPVHYLTLPGYSWDVMLHMTKAKIGLMQDLEMIKMVESGIRGGISMVTKKHAQANNPLLPSGYYNPEKPVTWLKYIDSNNLYGWGLSQPLPLDNFHWLTQDQIEQTDFTQVPDDASTGFILEVNLTYPLELHNLHNDFPLAPEHVKVKDYMLSPYSQELKKDLNIKGQAFKKLVPNLYDKVKYVVHYRNLKQYLSLGMKLTKVYRVLAFDQSPFMKPYIEFNTKMRIKAKDKCSSDLFKFMNNSVYGKTVENKRKRIDMRLATPLEGNKNHPAIKWVSTPQYKNFTIFGESLTGIQMAQKQVILDKPQQIGFSVLDLSKLHLYEFWYNFIKRKYGNKAELVLCDTDSFIFKVECPNFNEDMLFNIDLFDLRDYTHLRDTVRDCHRFVPGNYRDELQGKEMLEIIGLKSKMYSFIISPEEPAHKKAKGVNKKVTKNELTHNMYKTSLDNKQTLKRKMARISSQKHQVNTFILQNTALNPFDDKRWVLEDGVNTLAHGHYKSCK